MIARDAEPIRNVTPRPRIETSPVWPKGETIVDLGLNDEGRRIWSLVVGAAEGSNVGEMETIT